MTPAEMRELIRKLRADASVWDTEQAPLYAEAATALTVLLARVEGMEEALREIAALEYPRSLPGSWPQVLAERALSGGE